MAHRGFFLEVLAEFLELVARTGRFLLYVLAGGKHVTGAIAIGPANC